jgi:hypothetical protein
MRFTLVKRMKTGAAICELVDSSAGLVFSGFADSSTMLRLGFRSRFSPSLCRFTSSGFVLRFCRFFASILRRLHDGGYFAAFWSLFTAPDFRSQNTNKPCMATPHAPLFAMLSVMLPIIKICEKEIRIYR